MPAVHEGPTPSASLARQAIVPGHSDSHVYDRTIMSRCHGTNVPATRGPRTPPTGPVSLLPECPHLGAARPSPPRSTGSQQHSTACRSRSNAKPAGCVTQITDEVSGTGNVRQPVAPFDTACCRGPIVSSAAATTMCGVRLMSGCSFVISPGQRELDRRRVDSAHSGRTGRLSEAADWSHPPTLTFTGTPPPEVTLERGQRSTRIRTSSPRSRPNGR
jgi:hypothetical protein